MTYITPSITIGVHSIVLPRAAFEFAGVVGPGRFEPGHVVAIDLLQLGIPHAAGVVADARPVDVALRLRESGTGECQQADDGGQARSHRSCLTPGGGLGPARMSAANRKPFSSGSWVYSRELPRHYLTLFADDGWLICL